MHVRPFHVGEYKSCSFMYVSTHSGTSPLISTPLFTLLLILVDEISTGSISILNRSNSNMPVLPIISTSLAEGSVLNPRSVYDYKVAKLRKQFYILP